MYCNFGISLAEDDDSTDSLQSQDVEYLLYGEIQRRTLGESGNFEKEESEWKTESEKEIELLPEAGKQKSKTEVKAVDEEMEEEGKVSVVEGKEAVLAGAGGVEITTEIDNGETRAGSEKNGGGGTEVDLTVGQKKKIVGGVNNDNKVAGGKQGRVTAKSRMENHKVFEMFGFLSDFRCTARCIVDCFETDTHPLTLV